MTSTRNRKLKLLKNTHFYGRLLLLLLLLKNAFILGKEICMVHLKNWEVSVYVKGGLYICDFFIATLNAIFVELNCFKLRRSLHIN